MKVLETIHNIFKVERIDDKLIFKVSVFQLTILFHSSPYLFIYMDQLNSGVKIDVHVALERSIEQQRPGWWVRSEVTCVANNNEYRPNVGGWRNKPSLSQRTKPIVYRCPHPDLWIEVIY